MWHPTLPPKWHHQQAAWAGVWGVQQWGHSPSQGSMQHPMLLKSRLGQLGQHILLCNTVHVAQTPQALVQHWLHVVQLTVWLCNPICPKENPPKNRGNPKFSKGQLALAKSHLSFQAH